MKNQNIFLLKNLNATPVAIRKSCRNTFNKFTLLKFLCFLSLTLLMLFASVCKAQNVSTYCFTQTSGLYSSISGTSITLAGGNADDGYSTLLPIGFNFSYHGTVFTQFSASTNGYIQLGVLASSTTTYTPLASLPNCISFFGGNGKVHGYPAYVTSGIAPNRIFTIEYNDYYVDYANTTNVLYIELKLYETTNVIQVVYGASAAVNDLSKQVGLTGATVADFNDRKSSSSWAATIAGTMNTDSITWSSTVYPASGETYTWTPPVAISVQPSTATQNVCPSGVASAITITSTATTYQWYSNIVASTSGGTLISGATSSSYIPSTSTIGTLYYYCVVSSSCGSLTSNVSGPVIVANPPNPTSVTATPSTVCNGSSTSLNATATGYTIDWYTVSTGGTSIGTSTSTANYVVSPTTTTTYYAEAEGNNFTSSTLSYTGTIVNWTVPTGVTSLTITAKGAQGSSYSSSYLGGLGASVQGTFTVTGGQVLSILVGQQYCSACSTYAGGGGGTFVANGASYTTATPMIVAGGGGGCYSSGTGAQGGQITNITTTGDGGGPVPGTAGNGAASTSCGGGGGGFYTSGGCDTYYGCIEGNGGTGFRQGGAAVSSGYGWGGFGGGATADYDGSCNMDAGAGGGYSGGSGLNSTTVTYVGFGGGSYNSGTSQTNTAASNSGNGQVIISYFTPSCASLSRVPVVVTVIPGPVFSIQPDTTTQTLCFNGASTPLTVTAVPVTSYQWYSNTIASNTGGTLISGATNSTFTPPTSAAGTLYYYCEATSGCSYPSNVSGPISVYPANGIPTLSGGTASICDSTSPGTLTATGTGGNGTYTYLWYIGGVSTGITTQTYNPGNLTSDTSIYCAVTSCGATQNSAPFIVSVISAPPNVTATPPTVCPGSSTSLSAIYPGFYINWYTVPTGGTIVGTTTSGANYVVSPTSATTYYAEAELGGSGSTTISYTGAITTWTVPAGVTSITIQAMGAQGGSNTSASATGGLGASMTGTFTVTPTQVLKVLVGGQGTSVSCSSCAGGGGGGTFVTDISNNPLIIAGGGGGQRMAGSLTSAGTASTTGQNSADASGIGGSSGNGGSSGEPSGGGTGGPGGGLLTNGGLDGTAGGGPGFAFVNGGAGGAGCTSGTDIGGAGGFGCGGGGTWCYRGTGGGGGGYSGGGTGVNDDGGGGGGSFNNGTSQTNTAGVRTGNGQVIITWSSFSCSSTTRTLIVVNMATPASFSTQPSTVAQSMCINGTATALTAVASPVTGYQWYSNTSPLNTGGTLISGATTNTYTPLTTTSSTLYYYCVAIDSGCGIPSNVSGLITVFPNPTVNPIANQNYCNGVTTSATAISGPVSGSTFGWTNSNIAIGLTASGAGAIPSYTATNATSSPISATITVTPIANGCTGTPLTFTITIYPTPTASITGTTAICSGSTSTLTATSASSYLWSNSGTTQSISVGPTVSTTYTVTITDTHGCRGTASTLITVNTATATAVASPDTICTGSSSTLTSTGGGTYLWNTGGTTAIIPVIPTITTTYTVTITTSSSCTATAAVTVIVNTCMGISEMNSDNNFELYPNPADNTISIENTSSNTIKNASLTIYNIEGQLLLTQPMLQSKMDIDISQLARGMYYMELKSENGIGVKKFIKD